MIGEADRKMFMVQRPSKRQASGDIEHCFWMMTHAIARYQLEVVGLPKRMGFASIQQLDRLPDMFRRDGIEECHRDSRWRSRTDC